MDGNTGFKVKTVKRYLEDWEHQLEIQLKTRSSSLNRGEKYSRRFSFFFWKWNWGWSSKGKKSPNRHVDFSYSRKLGVCDTRRLQNDSICHEWQGNGMRKDFLTQGYTVFILEKVEHKISVTFMVTFYIACVVTTCKMCASRVLSKRARH